MREDDWIDEACGEYGTSIDPDTKPHTAMKSAIRGYLTAAALDGYRLVKLPDAKRGDADLSAYSQGVEVGWNNCRLVALATVITGNAP